MSSEHRLPGLPLILKTSPRAKTMRLRVDPRTGEVLLTIPRRVTPRKALAWAETQRTWIEAQLARVEPATAIGPGSIVPLYGIPHLIDWDPARPRRIEREEGALRVGGPEAGLEARVLRWLKAHARDLLDRETRRFAEMAGRPVIRVAVGDPQSRWGSCSSSGAIRYSWRLILAPDFVRIATVAHEVAHLVHMNHSPAFHAEVARLLGTDPRPARDWLRSHGAGLHRIIPRA